MSFNVFSPLQQLQHPYLKNLWVKRDDMIDPYVSGNKWRKLKYIIKDAASKGKTHLVTFGGAYSNHLVATAAAAAKNGFKTTAFVRGENVSNEMLVLCRLFGMNLIFTEREAYKHKQELYESHFKDNPETYFIDEGGASIEGAKGCAELIGELPADVDHLFCAAGTGTTAAGLLAGIRESELKTKLHIIPVLKNGGFIKEEISKYTEWTDQAILHADYHFGGYAKTTDQLLAYMKEFIPRQGILIDPVYTAKMFYAIDDLSKSGYFQPNEKIIALHTGGLLGIMGMKEKFK